MQIWDWMIDMTEKSTKRVKEWVRNNMERRKEMNRKAAKAYYDRKKDDSEYIEKRREQKADWARKNYKPASELTPEELEERRRKNREATKRYREAQKAKKAKKETANEEKGSPEA